MISKPWFDCNINSQPLHRRFSCRVLDTTTGFIDGLLTLLINSRLLTLLANMTIAHYLPGRIP